MFVEIESISFAIEPTIEVQSLILFDEFFVFWFFNKLVLLRDAGLATVVGDGGLDVVTACGSVMDESIPANSLSSSSLFLPVVS